MAIETEKNINQSHKNIFVIFAVTTQDLYYQLHFYMHMRSIPIFHTQDMSYQQGGMHYWEISMKPCLAIGSTAV